jgi:hypothetical protein
MADHVAPACLVCGRPATLNPRRHEAWHGHRPRIYRDGRLMEYDLAARRFRPIAAAAS